MCGALVSESDPTVEDTTGSPHALTVVPAVGSGCGVPAGVGCAHGADGSLSVGEADVMAGRAVW